MWRARTYPYRPPVLHPVIRLESGSKEKSGNLMQNKSHTVVNERTVPAMVRVTIARMAHRANRYLGKKDHGAERSGQRRCP